MRISDWSSDVCSSDREAEEAAVRYGDPVGVSRQIGEHRLGARKRRLGIDHPALLPDGREVAQECASFGTLCHAAEDGELPTVLEGAYPGQEQAAEQGAERVDRRGGGGGGGRTRG